MSHFPSRTVKMHRKKYRKNTNQQAYTKQGANNNGDAQREATISKHKDLS